MRTLTYYVAVSLDGFIAAADGATDRFSVDPAYLAALAEEYPETMPTVACPALGIEGGPRHFDTVVMGRRTHQLALDAGLTSGYRHLRQYVVTHDPDLGRDDSVRLHHGEPRDLVRRLKGESDGMGVWLCGGGDLAGQLVEEIDELHLKINPVSLGRGVPLLGTEGAPSAWSLIGSRAFGNGVVLARYRRRRSAG